MTRPRDSIRTVLGAVVLGLLACPGITGAQTYSPSNWVNDPFCLNPNYSLSGAKTASPCFTNNGVQRGTLYANSPIGASLTLVNPGDALSCTGQVQLVGDINPDGNMQFRIGLLYRGANASDTNWLGYLFGNPTGVGAEAGTGLYLRKNPNTGVYASGSAGQATRPRCEGTAYRGAWNAGAYSFSLSVSLQAPDAQRVAWSLNGISPSTYSYSGAYTNRDRTTQVQTFDQVGLLGGAALFNSAATSHGIAFTNVAVVFQNAEQSH